MKFYRKYFFKEIKNITYLFLLVGIAAIIFDQLFNYKSYPFWISWFNYSLIALAGVLFLLSILTKIGVRQAFIIYIYFFTINIYFPAFIGDEGLRQAIISSFSNLGACMIYVFMAGLIGAGIHVLILGGVNILLILLVLATSRFQLQDVNYFDPINLLMFILTSTLVYFMFWGIEKSLIENDENKKIIMLQEKELFSLRLEEERKRNSFLSIIQSENDLFVSKVITQLNSISKEKDSETKTKQFEDLKQLCVMQGYRQTKSNNARWNKETDSDFVSTLKKKYPELTQKELHICSLIRVNLSTKDIAENLNISTETIKWYRKRIRKKLDINDDHSMVEFLSEINNDV
jgi:DNA-binding CsgD family transcriptional regulator